MLNRIARLALPDGRASLILFLSGCNLIIIQWIIIRELTALLLGTELVALFVTASVFVGFSFGYLLSDRVSERALKAFAVLTLPLHLAMPVVYRLVIGSLDSAGNYRVGFILLLAITPFAVTAFYSLFLPRYANVQGNLTRLYAVELAGGAAGVILLRLVGGHDLLRVYLPYTILLVALLWQVGIPRPALAGLAALGIVWLVALPALDTASNAFVYRTVHSLNGADSLASVYSPYQKVDVIRDENGRLYLYLNGLEDFGSDDLMRFNVMLSSVPAQLVHPDQMAVVGSGSMASVGFAAPFAGHVTTVELDSEVADLSQRYFGAFNHLDKITNWTLVVDDAKHYFGNTPARFGLIAMDVPAPFTVQEGALHSREYYALLKQHLAPGGVVSVSLSSTFTPTRTLALRVVAGLLANFKEVVVVTASSADLSFAYASDALPFSMETLDAMLRANGESQFIIYQPEAVRIVTGDASPIRIDDMRLVWDLSLSRVRRLLGLR